MKKLILIIAILGSAYLTVAQNMYLAMETDTWANKYTYYNYDADWNLETIYVVYSNDTLTTRIYSNDTLVKVIRSNYTMHYYYHGDSALYFREEADGSYDLRNVYYLNEDNEVTHDNNCDDDGNYTYTINFLWENGNCVKQSYDTLSETHFSYNDTIVNPYYNENKYFKRIYYGSKNLLSIINYGQVLVTKTVLKSKNGYPLEIEHNESGGYSTTLLYDYYDLTDVNDGVTENDAQVLDLKYYNLLGQEIPKPIKGFYIEKKITTKGVLSKKYFIQ